MSEKRKHQHTLPNRQLARAFQFTAQDLAANRAGFMTRGQEWGIPMWVRRAFAWAGESALLQVQRPVRRRSAAHICGKIRLQQELHEVHGGRFQIDFLTLTVAGRGERFRLNHEQYRLLADRMPYHIYYDTISGRILSLERAIPGCSP